MISIKRIMFYKSGRGREAVHEREDAADASQALNARKAKAAPMQMGPWPPSAMLGLWPSPLWDCCL